MRIPKVIYTIYVYDIIYALHKERYTMKTKDQIATIIESVANKRAAFDDVDALNRFTGAEMDEYLDSLFVEV